MYGSGAFAEGTAQLMPSGAAATCITYIQGNDGTGKEGSRYGRPWYDKIYVHIDNPDTETIYYGFTRKLPTNKNIFYQILRPDGTIACSGQVANSSANAGFIADNGVAAYVGPAQTGGTGGYTAIECNPDQAGDYVIQFNVNHATTATPNETKFFIHPFDVTVANIANPASPVAVPGRLFSYRWHLNTNSSTNKACMEFYTWTPDSLVVMMDMNEIQPFGFSVSFNSTGCTQTGNIAEDRKSRSTASLSVHEYRVFLNPPDESVYPTGTPGEVTYVSVNQCNYSSEYCINIVTTKPGEINVFIDLDGNGQYDAGGVDVYFPYRTQESGNVCIPWNGMDANGDPVPPDLAGLVMVQYLAGIVHYPVWDPETHSKGFNCAMIRPVTLQPKMYHDNSATPIGTVNLSGCTAGCNTWGNNKGDNVMVNTWINAITSQDTAEMYIYSACHPDPLPDSICTGVNQSIELSLASNDSDPDGDLDRYTITLSNPSYAGSTYSYNPVLDLLHFTPLTDDSTRFELTYEICDETPPEKGGILCSRSQVVIDITNTCVPSSILAGSMELGGIRLGGDVLLEWQLSTPDPVRRFRVESSEDGRAFAVLAELEAGEGPLYRGSHQARSAPGRRWYRITAAGSNGAVLRSNLWSTVSMADTETVLLYPNPVHAAVTLVGDLPRGAQFELVDMQGKRWLMQQLQPMSGASVQLDVSQIPPGVYQAVIRTPSRSLVRSFTRLP